MIVTPSLEDINYMPIDFATVIPSELQQPFALQLILGRYLFDLILLKTTGQTSNLIHVNNNWAKFYVFVKQSSSLFLNYLFPRLRLCSLPSSLTIVLSHLSLLRPTHLCWFKYGFITFF